MTTPTIVTLAGAQAHLKIAPAQDGSPSIIDADLQQKLDAAFLSLLDGLRVQDVKLGPELVR